MVNVKGLNIGPLATNCFIVWDDATRSAVVIDPGADVEKILDAIQDLRVDKILLTHGHFDHIAGVQALKDKTSAPVFISERERDWLTHPKLNRSAFWPDFFPKPISGPPPDVLVHPNDEISFGDHKFKALFTPGHTPGHMCFLLEDVLFSGDALFSGTIGRTDLPEGDQGGLLAAIRNQLLVLPEDTRVLPGHGSSTTIGAEAASNPFLAGR